MQYEFIGIAIAALAALLSAVSAVASWLQVIELKKQRERDEQPYIYGHFQASYKGAIYFILENKGNSPALNVEAKFDPAPRMHNGASLNEASLFSNPILFFPPGGTYRQLVDVGHQLLADNQSTRFNLNLKYKSIVQRTISDRIEYDLTYLKGVTISPQTKEESLADLADYVKKLYKLAENDMSRRSRQESPNAKEY